MLDYNSERHRMSFAETSFYLESPLNLGCIDLRAPSSYPSLDLPTHYAVWP